MKELISNEVGDDAAVSSYLQCIPLCRTVEVAEEKNGCGGVILCITFPPLAAHDKGGWTVILPTILTCAGWIPGV